MNKKEKKKKKKTIKLKNVKQVKWQHGRCGGGSRIEKRWGRDCADRKNVRWGALETHL